MPRSRFQEILTAAVDDISQHGFDSQNRVDHWLEQIKAAAIEEMISETKLDESLRQTFQSIYNRLVEREGLFFRHKGVERFTINKVKPQLRAELDRRILASRELVKLNREKVL